MQISVFYVCEWEFCAFVCQSTSVCRPAIVLELFSVTRTVLGNVEMQTWSGLSIYVLFRAFRCYLFCVPLVSWWITKFCSFSNSNVVFNIGNFGGTNQYPEKLFDSWKVTLRKQSLCANQLWLAEWKLDGFNELWIMFWCSCCCRVIILFSV